jgi:cell division septation protein DedD
MTERVKGFTVTLSTDLREDDVQSILTAVRLIRGVAHVEPSLLTTEDHMNRMRIKNEIETKLFKALNEK